MIVNSAALQSIFKGFKTLFNEAFAGTKPTYEKVATVVPSSTKSEEYGWLGAFPRLRKWVGDRVINSLAAHGYTIKNESWEATVEVHREDIEDESHNTTRFVVLGRHAVGISGRDKTSLIMSTPNRTGSLCELLMPFSELGVSMTRLESRPARHTLWEYVFYVDIEGHRDDPEISAALQKLEHRAAYLKVLGSYPVAVY